MPSLVCIADRFVVTGHRHAIDLATAGDVTIVVSAIGADAEHARWLRRCDEAYQRHVFGARNLVDFGGWGETRRFEAWTVAHAAANAAANAAHPFPAIAHIERRVERALAELFQHAGLSPRIVYLHGAAGMGKSRLLTRLARSARMQGFVPLAVDLANSPFAAAIEGRSVCLIDDERHAAARVLVDVALRSPRPHVMLCASADAGRPGIALARLPAEALATAVLPAGRAVPPRLRRAATRAGGNPGRFIHHIRADIAVSAPAIRLGARRSSVAGTSRAAEQAPVYGGEPAGAPIAWPMPGEVAALRRQIADGLRHLEDGRHAPGERALRQAIGGLTRRGEWTEAADGSLALAASLLKRGRPHDARTVVDAARDACRRAAGDRALIMASTLSGTACVDLGRLDEAESVLAAAHVVAERSDDRRLLVPPSLALARARFWRGCYADAEDVLKAVDHVEIDPATQVAVSVMRVRLAVAGGDVQTAVSSAAAAVEQADALARFDLVATASAAAAFAHLAAGDLEGVRRDVIACRTASRAARDPLRRMRAELILVEHLRRAGLLDEARRLFGPLRRVPASTLPRVVRCRRDLLAELLTPGVRVADALVREIAASGFRALALFVPKERGQAHHEVSPRMVEDAMCILRICQTAADEAATLSELCDQLARQTHGVAAAVFGVEAGGLARLASQGRVEPGAAQRAVDAGIVIAPHQHDDHVEAAAPVKYGGAAIGALAIRWVIGSTPDQQRVGVALEMAAIASAPIVASALAGRRRADAAVFGELLGVSKAIVDVRRAAERAAGAPFAALIEGESGSGKELVARAIHKGGPRRDRPFVTLNCAALPDDLVESELFGHARGAFTGAIGERVGVFEEAHTGTLFLDEVGELSARAQAKLLRVIQEGELRRIGENTSRRIDVRVVSATNRDLRSETAAGRFRLDLLYRLDVLRVTVPPLRDRREDIPVLAEHLWREASARCGSRAVLGAPVVSALTKYAWPGNVRELQNVLAALAVRAGRRGVVPLAALPPVFTDAPAPRASRLDQARRVFEENFVRAALVRCGGRRVHAAAELGITRQGLAKLMSRLGIADGELS